MVGKMGFFKKKKDIKNIYTASGNSGCIASNRITIDGMKVGYMYRENPAGSNFPDSGWRFFAGDESEEYSDNPQNFKLYDLNTICNYDSSIIDFLDADYGTAFFKENGIFIKEKLQF